MPRVPGARARVAAAGALVIAIGLVAAPAAQAGQSSAIAQQRLMSAADIPLVLGRFPAVSVGEPVDPIITLCQDAGYGLFSVPAPERLTSVTTNGSAGGRYRSVTEDVYRFDSPAAAATSFAGLVTASASCSGTTNRRDEGGYTVGVRLSTGRVPAGATRPGAPVWTRQQTAYTDVPADSPLANHRDVLYRVFTRSGEAIIVTTYFVNGAAAISSRQAAAVQRLAVGNAARFASRR